MRQYFLSVIAAALICGILGSFLKKNKILNLLCGLLLVITIIRPLLSMELPELPELGISFDAGDAVSEGKRIARDTIEGIITADTEAYILDKAEALGVTLTVEVMTEIYDGCPVPVAVTLSGEISPEDRQALSQIIEDDLSISKENQIWTDER